MYIHIDHSATIQSGRNHPPTAALQHITVHGRTYEYVQELELASIRLTGPNFPQNP